ncbi:AAA family ATPase, partial [Mycolicibacterium neoaurum]|uniref:AAA family ATPase n=1 Tax=Mycolicibacterium neoaurum TaxID=1795 RepID=UPI002673D2DB
MTVGDGHSLATDQREAALRIATAPQSLTALIGPAGTGKTTCLSALRQVWEDQHGPGSIVGLAPSAVAASVLSKEIDVPTDNVSKWLWESTGPGAQQRQEQIARAQQQMDQLLAQLDDSPSAAQQRSLR